MIADFVIWLVKFVAVFAILMFIIIFSQRIISTQITKKRQLKRDEILPALKAFLVGDATVLDLIETIGKALDIAEPLVLEYLRDLTGSSRTRLLEAAQTLGLIEKNLRDLNHYQWARRDLAAMRLGIYGVAETVPELVKRLTDTRMEVRYTAARSLGMIGSPQAIEALIEILDQPDLLDTPRVLEIVQSMPNMANEPLRRMLDSPDHNPAAKLLAIDLVGDLRDYSMLDLLHQILNSSDKEKVVRAIKAIGKIAAPQSVEEILHLVHDRSWEVRAQAMKAIGLLDIKEGLPMLVEGLSDRAYWVRRNAADALVMFNEDGYEALRNALESDDEFARDMASYELERMGEMAPDLKSEPVAEDVTEQRESLSHRPFLPAGGAT